MGFVKRLLYVGFAGVLVPVGCSSNGIGDEGDDLEIIDDAKADNYYSSVAAEFEVEGAIPVALTSQEYADAAVRNDRVARRLTAVGLYLTAYVTAKIRGIDRNRDGQITEDEVVFHNLGYGAFQAMVRNHTIETRSMTAGNDGTYSVKFTIDMAGPKNLLTRIPGEDTSDGRAFDLKMPKGASMVPAGIPREEFRHFDPETHVGDLETVRLKARRLPVPKNAYPEYAAFLEDGVFDITFFFGHDYNQSRSDLRVASMTFSSLKWLGFSAPADSFAALTADSGPFVKHVKANGKEVRLEARIFHSEMFKTARQRQRQHDLALSEFVARDVFFYLGHAGPYFGFYLDEERVASVNYREFASAPFRADRRQLFFAHGCQTYSQYADMVYANPQKDEGNLDVITTVNYSYGQGSFQLFKNLFNVGGAGDLKPSDFYKIVGDINSDWMNNDNEVFFGVMGIDGNPQLHPFANVAAIGQECKGAADCGDTSGNVCARSGSEGGRKCGAVALAENACPAGTRYRSLASGATIQGGACFK